MEIDTASPESDCNHIHPAASDRPGEPAHLPGLGMIERSRRIGSSRIRLLPNRPDLDHGSLPSEEGEDVELTTTCLHIAGDHLGPLPLEHLNREFLGEST